MTDIYKRLGARDRPDCVSRWISLGRPEIFDAGLGDASSIRKFREQWWKWWKGIQPEWHSSLVRVASGDLSPMQIGGRNGVLSVIVSLGWWAATIKNDAERLEWISAVQDVCWVVSRT